MAITYGKKLARLCCIITHPEYQGKGYAFQITQKLLHILNENGFSYIELDASDQGEALYKKFGFQKIGTVDCYQLSNNVFSSVENLYSVTNYCIQDVIDLDQEAFGMDRRRFISKFVENYPEGFLVDSHSGSVDGFLYMTRRNQSLSIGPWIHRNSKGAIKILSQALAMHPGININIYAFSANSQVRRILVSFDFVCQMSLTRMVRGQPTGRKENSDIYYGLMSPVAG